MWALERLGPLAMLGGPSVGRDLPPVKSVSHQEERWVVDSEPGMGRACSESPQAWLSQTVLPSERSEEWGSWAAGPGEAPLCSQTEDSPPKTPGTQRCLLLCHPPCPVPNFLFSQLRCGHRALTPASIARANHTYRLVRGGKVLWRGLGGDHELESGLLTSEDS